MTTAEEISEHYDQMAPFYRLFWGDHIHHGLFCNRAITPEEAQLQLVEHCVGLMSPIKKCEALDAGCGHGATCIHLARKYGCRTTGISISRRQVEIAKAEARKFNLNGAARFHLADIEEIDLPTSVFDIVWTMEASEHFQDKPAYIHNAAGALKPGGKILIAAWTGSMASPRVCDVAQRFLCPSLQTADDYGRQLRDAGLTVLHQQNLTEQVQYTWELCRGRVEAVMNSVGWLPETVRNFVNAIHAIQEAYERGDLSYSVLVALKPRE